MDYDFLLRVPLNPTSVIAGRNDYTPLHHTRGVVIYDHGVARPSTTTDYTMLAYSAPLVNGADVSVDGTKIYGIAAETLGTSVSLWNIGSDGFTYGFSGGGFPTQSFEVRCSQSFCLSGSGYLVDASTLQVIKLLTENDSDGIAALDVPNNRAYLITGSGLIQAFDLTTYAQE